jgi:hypothetical protein
VFHRSLNENLRDFLAHKVPYYGMRYLGLEGVYGNHLETRFNVDLEKVRLAVYTSYSRYIHRGAIVTSRRAEKTIHIY